MERQDRQTYAEMQIAATFVAAGGKGVEMPTIAGSRSTFDAALNAPPASPRLGVIEEALGLRRAG